MRLLNILVVGLLLMAAAYVYEIKYEATLRAERVSKMRSDVRHERDAIAALRAEWAQLENPARLQGLVRRHLTLGPMQPHQFDSLDRLPERAPQMVVPPPPEDGVAALIENLDSQPPADVVTIEGPDAPLSEDPPTGSVPPAPAPDTAPAPR